MAKLSRNILRNLSRHSGNDFDIDILSAYIDDGLWVEPKYTVLSSSQLKSPSDETDKTTKSEIKFDTYFENYIKAFDIVLLEQNFPNKFSKDQRYAI